MRDGSKTGIEKSNTDTVQPYRVWHEGYIVHFAKREDEAKRILAAVTTPTIVRKKGRLG